MIPNHTLEPFNFALEYVECFLEGLNPSVLHVLSFILHIFLPCHVTARLNPIFSQKHYPVLERYNCICSMISKFGLLQR